MDKSNAPIEFSSATVYWPSPMIISSLSENINNANSETCFWMWGPLRWTNELQSSVFVHLKKRHIFDLGAQRVLPDLKILKFTKCTMSFAHFLLIKIMKTCRKSDQLSCGYPRPEQRCLSSSIIKPRIPEANDKWWGLFYHVPLLPPPLIQNIVSLLFSVQDYPFFLSLLCLKLQQH